MTFDLWRTIYLADGKNKHSTYYICKYSIAIQWVVLLTFYLHLFSIRDLPLRLSISIVFLEINSEIKNRNVRDSTTNQTKYQYKSKYFQNIRDK